MARLFSRVLCALVIATALASVARATDVTVNGVVVTNGQIGGSVAYVRAQYDQTFVDSLGNTVVGGLYLNNFYTSVQCAVAGSQITCPPFTLASTTDSSVPSARVTLVLYDAANRSQLATLFNWRVPPSPASTTAQQLNLYTAGQPRPLGDAYMTRDQVVQYFTGSLFSGRATTATAGIGKSSVNVADPVFVDKTDMATTSNPGVVMLAPSGDTSSGKAVQGSDSRLAAASTTNRGTVTVTTSNSQAVSTDDPRVQAASTSNPGVVALAASGDTSAKAVQGSDARLAAASTTNRGTTTVTTSNSQAVSTDDPRLSPATTSQSGLMSAADKITFNLLQSASCFSSDCIDLNASPYNATPGNLIDQSAAWQSGLNAAGTYLATHGSATIRAGQGAYHLSNPLTQNSIFNAQLTLPVISSSAPRTTLTIESKSQCDSAFPFLGGSGCVILDSTLTGQSYSLTYGKPFLMAGPDAIHGTSPSLASYLSVRLRGISFRAPQDPTLGGFNGEMLDHVVFENCAWGTTDPNLGAASQVVPTHPTGIAALGPREFFEGTLWLGTNTIAGWYAGFPIDEYTNGVGDMFAGQNVVNFNVSGSFYTLPIVSFATSIRGKYDIAHVDPQTGVTDIPDGLIATGFLPIRMTMRIENGPSPWNKIKNVLDGRNSLRGTIEYTQINSVVGLPSSDGLLATGLNNTGAYGVNFVNLLGPSLKRPVVHAQFVAPSSTALVSVPFTVNPSGATWSVPSGGLNADGNGALVGTSASPTYNRAFVNAGVADGLASARIYFPSVNGSAGIVFRASDSSNFWHFELDAAGNYGLTKVVAGVPASGGCSGVAGGAINPFSTGREIPLGVLMTGTTFRVLMNDNALCTITDSFNSTATNHGVETTGTVARVTEFMFTK